EIDATDCVVTPGLVNAHQHLSGDRFMRSSIPDDTPSGEAIFGWVQPIHAPTPRGGDRFTRSPIPADPPSGEAIFGWVQPMHAAHSPADDELSAMLTCMESIANGV